MEHTQTNNGANKMQYKTEQLKKDVLDNKIETFSTLNFHKYVFLNYKNGSCVGNLFDSVIDFTDFVKFLNDNKVKFEKIKP